MTGRRNLERIASKVKKVK
uniref:Uncharacterized protein n=1 Tax=Arundo donax TaxID=35708 RepID=A0A0A9BYM0_ARUDO